MGYSPLFISCISYISGIEEVCKRHCDVEKHDDEGLALLSKNENAETELMKGITSLIISLMLLMKKNSDLMVFLPSLFELYYDKISIYFN